MFRRILSLVSIMTLMFGALGAFAPQAQAQVSYNGGVYTNLCGSGTAATGLSCNGNCNTSTGQCNAASPVVVKFTCDGRTTDCRNNETSFASSQSVGTPSCGKTVQIDVFTKKCRDANGAWVCGDSDLKDYMVWYSGDCAPPTTPPTAPPTSRPNPHVSSCDALQVVSGNDQTIPSKVVLRASASDNKGAIQMYRFRFGDGTNIETTDREVSHTYEISGSIRPSVEVRDSRGRWITSRACETSLTIKPTPVESFKSGCSDLVTVRGNREKAPALAEFVITGYDTKDRIQKYRVDFGNGEVREATSNRFELSYGKAGTYTVKGYVQDSRGEWKGGENDCRTTLYVETAPLTVQPKTGTPTFLGGMAVAAGVAGGTALYQRWKLEHPTKKTRTAKRK